MSQVFYADPAENFVLVNIQHDNNFYAEIRQQYDGVKLGYIRGSVDFEGYGNKYFSIERINYYAYKDDGTFFLRYVDQTGVYDRNSKLLKKANVVNTATRFCVGVSSAALENPFAPNLVIQDTQKHTFLNTNVFAYIKIDFQNSCLLVYDPMR